MTAMMPAVGDPAPDFALPDEAGTIHRLADQRGRWTVIYFYPEDDTPGCTTEACSFRDAGAALAAVGATVWGISPDDAASHGRFRAKFHLDFPLLSDEDHATSEAYGAWRERTKDGVTSMRIHRSTFLVGPEGRIARTWPTVTPEGHAEEVAGAIAAEQARGE